MVKKLHSVIKKIYILRGILLLAILYWMNIIFGFSSDTAVESTSLSDKITQRLVHVFYSGYDVMDDSAKKEAFNNISFLVRKTGHFGEYAILGGLIALFLITFIAVRNNLKLLMWSEIIGIAYACSDEFHQGFVEGRSPGIRDVVIDAAGYFCALIFVMAVVKLIKHKKQAGIITQ